MADLICLTVGAACTGLALSYVTKLCTPDPNAALNRRLRQIIMSHKISVDEERERLEELHTIDLREDLWMENLETRVNVLEKTIKGMNAETQSLMI